MVFKNELYEAEITDLTINGDGVAKIDGYPIFVKDAVPGDKAQIRITKTNKKYGFAQTEKILISSPHRTESACPVFMQCGGCTLLHVDYDYQKTFKANSVFNNLLRIGGLKSDEFEFEGIIGAENPYYYRNKAQFPVGKKRGKAFCGFYSQQSHSIVQCDECKIQAKHINEITAAVLAYINENHISVYEEEKHHGTMRHIYVRYSENGDAMVVLVTNSPKRLKASEKLFEKLAPLGVTSLIQNINMQRTNVILGDKNIVLSGNDYIFMHVKDLKFKVSAYSFFQVNTAQMEKLYEKALEYAAPLKTDTVFDLYCGVGSISLFLAKKAGKVIGVEIVEESVQNAKDNAAINKIDNASFYCGDAGTVTKKLMKDGEKADILVLDPPRKGCSEDLLELAHQMNPKKIVYVSCNSATLARDVAILKKYGFQLKKCVAVDLFAQTTHVETVVLMSRKEK